MWSFFSEEKWLEDKTQALRAAMNHVERLKMEKEKLSEQRCHTYFFIFVLLLLSSVSCTIKGFIKMRFDKIAFLF